MSMCHRCGEHRGNCICAIVAGSAHVAHLERRIAALGQERKAEREMTAIQSHRADKAEAVVERLQGLVDTITETAKNRMAEVERLRAAMTQACNIISAPGGERRAGEVVRILNNGALTKPEGEQEVFCGTCGATHYSVCYCRTKPEVDE